MLILLDVHQVNGRSPATNLWVGGVDNKTFLHQIHHIIHHISASPASASASSTALPLLLRCLCLHAASANSAPPLPLPLQLHCLCCCTASATSASATSASATVLPLPPCYLCHCATSATALPQINNKMVEFFIELLYPLLSPSSKLLFQWHASSTRKD